MVAGAIEDAGDEAMWLRRTSSAGEVRWTRQGSGDSLSGDIVAVAAAADDRVAVTGTVEESADREDFWIAAWDPAGDPSSGSASCRSTASSSGRAPTRATTRDGETAAGRSCATLTAG